MGTPSTTQPFWVKDITGLGPVNADVVVNPNSGGIGGIVGSAKIKHRNILLTLGVNPFYSEGQNPTNLRQRLNAAFTPGREIKVKLIDSEIGTYDAFGYVESVDSPMFSKNSSAVISILCEDPYLKSSVGVTLNGVAETPLVIPDSPPHATGFVINVTFGTTVDSLRLINNYDPDLALRGLNIIAGDVLQISTVFGDKKIYVISGSGSRNALNTIDEGGLAMTIGNPANSILVRTNKSTWAFRYTLDYSPMLLGF